MKKRLASAALALTMLLALFTQTLSGRAATVYFTAANDTLLELSDNTMPFWNRSLLYVPATVFGSGGLGVNVTYNSAKKTLILRQSQFRLICNLSSGMTVDSDGNVHDFVALERHGIVFLPINAVCRLFGFSCVTRTVEGGNLVRVRNESASLTDDAFLSAAAPMIASRYAEYRAAHAASSGNTGSSTTTAPENSGTADDEPEGSAGVLYLALTVHSPAQLTEYLDCCAAGQYVSFLLTEEFFSAENALCAESLRRALAQGHRLALSVETTRERETLDALESGNRALGEMLCYKTRLAALASSQHLAASQQGYCPLRFDRSLAGTEELSVAQSDRFLSALSSGERVELGDALSATALRTLLARASARRFSLLGLRETVC